MRFLALLGLAAACSCGQCSDGGQTELDRRLDGLKRNGPNPSEVQNSIERLRDTNPLIANAALERLAAVSLIRSERQPLLSPAIPALTGILRNANSSPAAKHNALIVLGLANAKVDRPMVDALKTLVESGDIRLARAAILRLAEATEFRDEVGALFLAKLLDRQARRLHPVILDAMKGGTFTAAENARKFR